MTKSWWTRLYEWLTRRPYIAGQSPITDHPDRYYFKRRPHNR